MKIPFRSWAPGGAVVLGLFAVAAFAFREVLFFLPPGRLPGIDAGVFSAWEVYTREALAAGRWPHWNPYFWAGVPHFADSLTAVIYLPGMMLRWLPVPAFLSWMLVLHLVLGGAGVVRLCRVLRLSWPAAAAAALAFTLGGAAGSWLHLGHFNIVYSVVWLPWALALTMLSERRPSLLPHPGLPVVLAVQFFGGYTQGAAYIVAAVAMYYAFSVVWPGRLVSRSRRLRPFGQLAVLGLITFGLSAVQALPLIRLSFEMERTLELSFARAAGGGWSMSDLSTFFFPFTGIRSGDAYRVLSHRVAYVGLLLAWVAPFAWFDRLRRREVVFFAVLAAVAAAFAFGSHLPFYRLHYLLFPGFRVPGRLLVLVTLGVAVMGAVGLDRIVTLVRERDTRALVRGTACALILAAAAAATAYRNATTDLYPPVHFWPWLPAATGLALAVSVALSVRGTRAATIPALVVLACDLTAFAAGGVHTVPDASPATLRQWLGPPDGGRVITFCDRQVSSLELLRASRPGIEGPVGVVLRDYEAWRRMLGDAWQPSDTLGPLRVRRDLMNLAGISTVVSCGPIDAPSLTLLSVNDTVHVYRNSEAWPRVTWACGSQLLTRGLLMWRLRDARYDANRSLTAERVINVRWAPDVDDRRREELEKRYHLREAVSREGRTWRYPLADSTFENVSALLRDPAVEDTAGIDRGAARLADDDTLTTDRHVEPLVGTDRCAPGMSASVVAADQPDGHVAADVSSPVDGVVFFSEPYYSERRAYVDGRRVEALKAVVGFTAVPVPAGRHRVELRLVPTTFYAGLSIGAATMLIWGAAAWSARGRRKTEEG